MLRILKAAYGLSTAPRVFWQDFKAKIEKEVGAIPVDGDPCAWVVPSPSTGEPIGHIGCHVDDLLLSGDPRNPEWEEKRQLIKSLYAWGSWKEGAFRFVGIDLQQRGDFSIVLDQQFYADEISLIDPQEVRLSEEGASLNTGEHRILRSKLGALQWLAVQSRPTLVARCNLLLSEVKVGAPMSVALETQTLLKEARKPPETHTVVMQTFTGIEDWRQLCPIVFCDASLRNRHDLHSTGGLFAVLGPVVALDGEPVPLSPVGWRSWKLDRKALSSNHAEVQACNTSESLLFRLRVCWAALNLALGTKIQETDLKTRRY